VVLICFAVDSPDSLDNVQEKVSLSVCFFFLPFYFFGGVGVVVGILSCECFSSPSG
jgi:hypothetical protein